MEKQKLNLTSSGTHLYVVWGWEHGECTPIYTCMWNNDNKINIITVQEGSASTRQ